MYSVLFDFVNIVSVKDLTLSNIYFSKHFNNILSNNIKDVKSNKREREGEGEEKRRRGRDRQTERNRERERERERERQRETDGERERLRLLSYIL